MIRVTQSLHEKYYSNLANGFVEKIYKAIGPTPWLPCFFLDIIMHLRHLQESQLKTIYAKYHTYLASGFKDFFFLKFSI